MATTREQMAVKMKLVDKYPLSPSLVNITQRKGATQIEIEFCGNSTGSHRIPSKFKAWVEQNYGPISYTYHKYPTTDSDPKVLPHHKKYPFWVSFPVFQAMATDAINEGY